MSGESKDLGKYQSKNPAFDATLGKGPEEPPAAGPRGYTSPPLMAALNQVKPGNDNEQAGDLTNTPYASLNQRNAKPDGGKNVARGQGTKYLPPTNPNNPGGPQHRDIAPVDLAKMVDNMPSPEKRP
jgi:hypothetical protein